MRLTHLLAALAIVVLAGCANKPLQPIPLAAASVDKSAGRIGVAMSPLPVADTHLPGADCLLCLAAASVANSSLTSHTRQLKSEELKALKEEVAGLIRQRGGDALVIADDLKIVDLPERKTDSLTEARRDFTSLKARHEIDKLVVIEFFGVGFMRTYASYFPTSDPKAMMSGQAYLVDLKSQQLLWYAPISVLRATDGPWDESPKFPGLTNAYFQAIELARDEVLRPFKP